LGCGFFQGGSAALRRDADLSIRFIVVPASVILCLADQIAKANPQDDGMP
jgi:hypothetical protein